MAKTTDPVMHRWQRRALGMLALGGSGAGFAIGIQSLFSGGGNVATWTLTTLFVALYAVGMWCGVRMIEAHPGAERLNFNFWMLQVPLLQSPIMGYDFASGAFAFITYAPVGTKVGFVLRVGSRFDYSLLQVDKAFVVGVNVFALAMAWFLARAIRRAHFAALHLADTATHAEGDPAPGPGQ